MQRKKEFYKNILNSRHGNVKVLSLLRTEKRKGKIWQCKCDCGKLFETTTSKIIKNELKNCPDCNNSKNKERSIVQLTKHGKSNTRLHSIWASMKSRCAYVGDTNYKFYGMRGIAICEEWKNDFMKFYDWSLENGYLQNLSIDRIDVNGNYEPLNCRWVELSEQARNRRTTKFITVNGVTKTQSEWAKIIGISHTAFSQARRKGKDMEKYTLDAIKGNRIDIYCDSHTDAINRGRCERGVVVK